MQMSLFANTAASKAASSVGHSALIAPPLRPTACRPTPVAEVAPHTFPSTGASSTSDDGLASDERGDLAALEADVRALQGEVDEHTAAVLTDRVARHVLPRAERMASLAMVAWPDRSLDVDDLAQELTVEVLAALPWAPLHGDNAGSGVFASWLSATLLREMHQRWREATERVRQARRSDRHQMERLAYVESDEAGEGRVVATPAVAARLSLHWVLGRLPAPDAAVLRARAEGDSWPRLAARFGTSIRTVRRRHAAALARAQREVHGSHVLGIAAALLDYQHAA